MNAGNEESEPPLDTEGTVDDLERRVLGDEPAEEHEARRRAERPDEPAYDQDKDVEDMPGGAGEAGGSSDEPPS